MDQYKLHFIPLGGILGVTKNMYVYELYKNDVLQDIIIIDCGIGFPQEKELGVDFVIPDITYLADKKDKIRAILLTHGHEDHITALSYHYEALGRPPVYTAKLTMMFVENKFKESKQIVDINLITANQIYPFGDFTAQFVPTTHSIPDPMHIILRTPIGALYHGSDFKFDLTPPYGVPPDFYEIAKAGKDGLLCLMSDCLGADREGFTLSEAIVGQTFEDEMRKTKGKFIMTTFSSNISRIRQCVEAAVKFNRKIFFLGRSMRENTRLANEIGYLPIPTSLMGKDDEVMKLPPQNVCLIVAGSQGQYDSALSKLSQNQNKFIKIKRGDKVVFSSDPVPGNETEVYSLIEELSLLGAEVVYTDIKEQLHASGHGNQEDLKLLARLANPKYFIPIGGTIRHQRGYRDLIGDLGFSEKNVFLLDEGETVWFEKNKAYPGDPIETKNIYVDAYGVGDVGTIVLRDRKNLASEGIVMAVLILDKKGHLVTKPLLLSKGFVFEEDEEKLFENAVAVIEKVMKPLHETIIDFSSLKKNVSFNLESFYYRERGRKPLIIVEVVQL